MTRSFYALLCSTCSVADSHIHVFSNPPFFLLSQVQSTRTHDNAETFEDLARITVDPRT